MGIKSIKLKPKKDGFSKKELKRAKKALKEAGVPKPWIIRITDTETDEQIIFRL